jgi:restriction system protein
MDIFKYKFDQLLNPLLQALHNLGGSGSIQEIEYEVAKLLNLSEDEINDFHRGNMTKFSYRLAWARNYLKKYELIDNSSRGVWSLTPQGKNTTAVEKERVKRNAREIWVKSKKSDKSKPHKQHEEEIADIEWREEFLGVIQNLLPATFERLAQRMLREIGFINVEVTGKTGDGGIDGKGVMRIGGVLSFNVVFQCKRYKGSVSPSQIRDFRGAMIGRADKALFITTGTFTAEAKKESQRDGAPPIDLMDGYQFAEKFKELKLGVETVMVEEVKINKSFFENI